MSLDLSLIPFSIAGSYMALSYHSENFRGHTNKAGIYLRTVHYSAHSPFVCRIIPLIRGAVATFTYEEQPAELTLTTDAGTIRICYGDAETLLFEGTGVGLGLRLDYMAGETGFNYVFDLPVGAHTLHMAQCFKNNCKYLIDPMQSELSITQNWVVENSSCAYMDIVESKGSFLFSLREIFTDWDGKRKAWNYGEAQAATAKEFQLFYDSMPTVPAQYEEARLISAYVNWASIVKKCGFLTRDAMLMSKNWMAKIWSWDHCFNAIALSYGNPQAAWDQFRILFDLQQPTGVIPDSITDGEIIWNFCKPPIHGWALGKIMERAELNAAQLQDAYDCLSRWTMWWLNNRDRNQNGICEYTHGNDSGWDNSTAFCELPPVETPDLQAFLVLQMEVLATLATKMNRSADATRWTTESKAMLNRMLGICFDQKGMPQSLQAYTGKVIETESLLLYLPVILGQRLPADIRENLVRVLKSDRFLTEWGYATESPTSNEYISDGYWRGPIWAPSTMLLLDGLSQCGEVGLVQEVTHRFSRMILKSGCAENFDAQTGEGLRDRAYTWTSSAFLVMAHEYLMNEVE